MTRTLSCTLIAALVLAGACAPKLQTHVDFQPDVAFGSLSSFAVEPQLTGNLTDAQRANREVAARAVERQLALKGLRKVPAAEADLLVRPSTGTRAKVRLSGASSTGTYGGLVVDIVDRRTDRSVWRGVAYETVTGSMDVAAEIEKAAAELLAEFPPTP